jgi:hypothetical protein
VNGAAAACLRKLSVSRILSLQGTAAANGPYVNGLLVDGKVLPILATPRGRQVQPYRS